VWAPPTKSVSTVASHLVCLRLSTRFFVVVKRTRHDTCLDGLPLTDSMGCSRVVFPPFSHIFFEKYPKLFYEFIRNTTHHKHNKNYIEIFGPPNDYYCRQSELPTHRCCRSLTVVSLTLLITVGKSLCTCPLRTSTQSRSRRH
jgi:hypothetical protein